MHLYQSGDFVWNRPDVLTDGEGNVRFHLLGDACAPTRRLRLQDLAGREAVLIRQSLPALFPRYELEIYGRPLGALIRQGSSFFPDVPGWTLTGEPDGLEYGLCLDGTPAADCRMEAGRLRLTCSDLPSGMTALGLMLTVNCLILSGPGRHFGEP